MKLEEVKWGTWVKRTRKSDNISVFLRFGEAVNELASVLSSIEYSTRTQVAAALAGGSIETDDYIYQLEEGHNG